MENTELVSVVIPVYNEQDNLTELIRRCVQSCDILDQARLIQLELHDPLTSIGDRGYAPEIGT